MVAPFLSFFAERNRIRRELPESALIVRSNLMERPEIAGSSIEGKTRIHTLRLDGITDPEEREAVVKASKADTARKDFEASIQPLREIFAGPNSSRVHLEQPAPFGRAPTTRKSKFL
jgi:hypothetical protein